MWVAMEGRNGASYFPPLSMLGFYLAWGCSSLVHAVVIPVIHCLWLLQFSTPFSMTMPVLCEARYDVAVPFNADHFHTLSLYASWPLFDHCINHHLVQKETSLMKIETWINLQVYQHIIRSQLDTVSTYQNNGSMLSSRSYDLNSHRFW